jgi:hypothetical protein
VPSDPVNHPAHYNVGGVEVITAIEAWCLGYCAGNAVKYLARYQFKGRPLEDVKKAQWYVNRLVAQLEADEADVSAPSEPSMPRWCVWCEKRLHECQCHSPEPTVRDPNEPAYNPDHRSTARPSCGTRCRKSKRRSLR